MKHPTLFTATRQQIESAIVDERKRRMFKQMKHEKLLAAIHCKECDNLFEQTRHWQAFCSVDCSRRYHKRVAAEAEKGLFEELKSLREENTKLKERIRELEAKS